MEKINLLNVVDLTPTRRDGNTTRLIDKAVQIIFSGHVCVVRDHARNGNDYFCNKDLMKKIMKRIQNEHDIEFNNLIIDFNHLEISLKQ